MYEFTKIERKIFFKMRKMINFNNRNKGGNGRFKNYQCQKDLNFNEF